MPKVLKRNNTKKNNRNNKKKNKSLRNKSKKNTRGGMTSSLRLNLPQGPNMDCGPAFHPQWGSKNSASKQLGLPKMNDFTFNQEGNLGFIQQGGHAWRNHVRKVMKNNPSLKFGQVLSLAKKTYKRSNNKSNNKKSKNNKSRRQ
jgi:hypothetical protein